MGHDDYIPPSLSFVGCIEWLSHSELSHRRVVCMSEVSGNRATGLIFSMWSW